MYVSRVSLENFRNLASLDLSLDQGFVVFVGSNGSGKTNLLEALFYCLSLDRFTDSDFGQLFQVGKNHFSVRLGVSGSDHTDLQAIVQKVSGSYKYSFKADGQKTTRKKYKNLFSVSSFLPQDLNLLTRSPGTRRNYLNKILSNTSAEYSQSLKRYRKALKQRNEILTMVSNSDISEKEVVVWDEQIADTGSFLTRLRQKYIEFLNKNINKTLTGLSGRLEGIRFDYQQSGEADGGRFAEQLKKSRQRDIYRTTTTLGPHRDDFIVKQGDRPATGFLSRGQMRAVTLALKILESNFIEKETGKKPVILLDDVFSEFDPFHQEKLLDYLQKFNQVFMTTSHPEDLKAKLPDSALIFNIKKGKVKKA